MKFEKLEQGPARIQFGIPLVPPGRLSRREQSKPIMSTASQSSRAIMCKSEQLPSIDLKRRSMHDLDAVVDPGAGLRLMPTFLAQP
jgi:hypothetical protein